jgi:HlyD family secretion protein
MSSSMWTWRVVLPGLGLAACSLVLWQSSRPEGPRASPVAASSRPETARVRVIAEGRIVARPGAEIEVGSESGGMVASVAVVEEAKVRKGDLLVEFRADDLKFALAEAEARLAEADAELAFNQSELQRKIQAKSKDEPSETRRDVQVSVARRKAAEIAVGRARSLLARAKVTAPIDGVVMVVDVEPGEIAAPGARLVSICDLARLRIEAEIDEFDVSKIAPGEDVVIKAEGYEETWQGTVEEIPDRVAARTLLPGDPGRPSDTRILLVKIGLAQKLPLKLGQQLEVEIRPRR